MKVLVHVIHHVSLLEQNGASGHRVCSLILGLSFHWLTAETQGWPTLHLFLAGPEFTDYTQGPSLGLEYIKLRRTHAGDLNYWYCNKFNRKLSVLRPGFRYFKEIP